MKNGVTLFDTEGNVLHDTVGLCAGRMAGFTGLERTVQDV